MCSLANEFNLAPLICFYFLILSPDRPHFYPDEWRNELVRKCFCSNKTLSPANHRVSTWKPSPLRFLWPWKSSHGSEIRASLPYATCEQAMCLSCQSFCGSAREPVISSSIVYIHVSCNICLDSLFQSHFLPKPTIKADDKQDDELVVYEFWWMIRLWLDR